MGIIHLTLINDLLLSTNQTNNLKIPKVINELDPVGGGDRREGRGSTGGVGKLDSRPQWCMQIDSDHEHPDASVKDKEHFMN